MRDVKKLANFCLSAQNWREYKNFISKTHVFSFPPIPTFNNNLEITPFNKMFTSTNTTYKFTKISNFLQIPIFGISKFF
jgi:hypothetical protein